MLWIVVIVAVVLGFYMAWVIGANDVANSMADAVGSKALSVRHAIIAAGICEFAGAVLVGAHVTQTIRGGIIPPEAITDAFAADAVMGEARAAAALVIGMSCALLAAALWLNAATLIGSPVSTTHSIVGAIAGFGIVVAGPGAVRWGTMGRIVASWFISPVVGAVLAIVFFKFISWSVLSREHPLPAARRTVPLIAFFTAVLVILSIFYKGFEHLIPAWLTGAVALLLAFVAGAGVALVFYVLTSRRLRHSVDAGLRVQLAQVERVFAPLVIATSCCVAFSHGANDVANAVGPLAAVVHIVSTGRVLTEVATPLWILVLGGLGIVTGLAMLGHRVMRTVGEKITQLTPSRGVAADVAATATVLACSRLGMPVSTTHTLVGAILGIGLVRGLGAINMRVTKSIFGSWLVTVPIVAVLSMLLFVAARPLLLERLAQYLATVV